MPPHLRALLSSVLYRPRPNQPIAHLSSLKNPAPAEHSPDKGLVVSFLVNSCGLSLEDAIAASKRVHFDTPVKPKAFVDILLKQGFTKPQISSIVRARPTFLLSNAEKFIIPKLQFFLRSLAGFTEKEVLATLSKHPHLLAASLERKLAPNVDYLEDLLGTEKMGVLFRRNATNLIRLDIKNRVGCNVDSLREIGVPPSCLRLAFSHCVGIFSLNPTEFRKLVQEVREMGFDPSKTVFVLALHARSGKARLALWDQSYQVYQKWGWSRDDIFAAFLKHPYCMLCSKEKITAVLEFVVHGLGREARSVARHPAIIFYSMDKRIVPRCTILRDLASKGLVKKDWNLKTVLQIGEKDFVERYVLRFGPEAPKLYETYLSRKPRDGRNVAFLKLTH